MGTRIMVDNGAVEHKSTGPSVSELEHADSVINTLIPSVADENVKDEEEMTEYNRGSSSSMVSWQEQSESAYEDDAESNPENINNEISTGPTTQVQSPSKKRNPVLIPNHITQITTSDEEIYYKCEGCQSQFSTKYHVKFHAFCVNGDNLVKPFTCEQCGQGFVQRGHFEYHQRTHSGERPFTCETCGKGFMQSGKLNRHKKTHSGERPFICQVEGCGKQFANKSALQGHQIVHTGLKPYKCPHCPRSFSSMSNMTKHTVTHTGEKPHSCKECGKRFALKWTLAMHEKTHLPVKPFPCTLCEKGFSVKKDLQRHLLIHKGEMPFNCPFCGKLFRRKDNLLRHVASVHKNSALLDLEHETNIEQQENGNETTKVQSSNDCKSVKVAKPLENDLPNNNIPSITVHHKSEVVPPHPPKNKESSLINNKEPHDYSVPKKEIKLHPKKRVPKFRSIEELVTTLKMSHEPLIKVKSPDESKTETVADVSLSKESQSHTVNTYPRKNRADLRFLQYGPSSKNLEEKEIKKYYQKPEVSIKKQIREEILQENAKSTAATTEKGKTSLELLAEVASSSKCSELINEKLSQISLNSYEGLTKNGILIVGASGVGKSYLCNRLMELFRPTTVEFLKFDETESLTICTKVNQYGSITINNVKYTLIDTPGFSDSYSTESTKVDKFNVCEVINTIEACEQVCAIIYVFTARFTLADKIWFKRLRSLTEHGDHVILVNNKVSDITVQFRHIADIKKLVGDGYSFKYSLITFNAGKVANAHSEELEKLIDNVGSIKPLTVKQLLIPEICYEREETGEKYVRLISEHTTDEGMTVKETKNTNYYCQVYDGTRKFFGLFGPQEKEGRWVTKTECVYKWQPKIVKHSTYGEFQRFYKVRYDGKKDLIEEKLMYQWINKTIEEPPAILEESKKTQMECKEKMEKLQVNYSEKLLMFSKGHEETVETAMELSQAFVKLEMFKESIDLILDMLRSSKKFLKDRPEQKIRLMFALGEALEASGNIEGALDHYAKAVDECNSLPDSNNTMKLNAQYVYGRLLVKGDLSQVSQGRTILREVLRAREHFFGVEHPINDEIRRLLNSLPFN